MIDIIVPLLIWGACFSLSLSLSLSLYLYAMFSLSLCGFVLQYSNASSNVLFGKSLINKILGADRQIQC